VTLDNDSDPRYTVLRGERGSAQAQALLKRHGLQLRSGNPEI
jgi:hypothetical protein